MDNKQIPNDKIAAEELIKDSELDSVAGGGQTWGGTGVGCLPVFNSQSVQSDPTDDVLVFGQLGPG